MREIKVEAEMLYLGKEGENNAARVRFPVRQWRERYGDGTFQLIAQRQGDAAPYPVAITTDENFVCWNVTGADTAVPGMGRCELRYIVGDTLAKSQTWVTRVLDALGEPGDAPEPYESWLDEILSAGTVAQEYAAEAEKSAEAAKQAEQRIANMTFTEENGRLILIYE